jgi:uncharacterized membrane protein YkvA (DUF1232 family)
MGEGRIENKYFKRAQARAKDLIGNNEKLGHLIERSKDKLSVVGNSKLIENAKVFIRMVKAYVNGSYREVPLKSIVMVVAALLYFVMPLDLIADFIPVTGLVDDFAVILWVYKQLHSEIEAFVVWEQGLNEPSA